MDKDLARDAVFAAVDDPDTVDVRTVADVLVEQYGDLTLPALAAWLRVSEYNLREVLSQ